MLKKYGLYFAWVIALLGTLSTLYLSEGLGWPVCHLCWYQRVCLYPLVIILGIACFRNDRSIISYVIALPIIGALFSLYQYLMQMIPGFGPIRFCSVGADCSAIHMQWLGFITLPFLGLVGFIAILFFLIVSGCGRKI